MGGWEGGIRVPTIVSWPGVIPANTVIDTATSHMDFLPTIAAAVNVDIPSDRPIDGANILPLLTGSQPNLAPHEFMFHYCGTAMHAVRWSESPRKFSSHLTSTTACNTCRYARASNKLHNTRAFTLTKNVAMLWSTYCTLSNSILLPMRLQFVYFQ